MCCVAEAMGMSLPGSATIPATHAARLRSAQAAGRQIVELTKQGITARMILNEKGIENGIRLGTAIGGSTNLALHIPAIGYEADSEVSMERFEALARTTPHIAKMNPAAPLNVPDFHAAGGVPAVMRETSAPAARRCARPSPARRWRKTWPDAASARPAHHQDVGGTVE